MVKELALLRWSRIIEDQVRSGLNAKEYCLREEINLSRFLHRRKELHIYIKSEISVKVADSLDCKWPNDASFCFDGVSITFEVLSSDTLRNLLNVVRACRQIESGSLSEAPKD